MIFFFFYDSGLKNMGYVLQILHMICIIIIFMFLSFHCIHILIVDASPKAAGYFNVHGLQEVFYMEGNAYGKEDHIAKVSGGDDNEEKEGLILEKFRALLGLKRFNIKRPYDGDSESVSPSAAPSPSIEAEAPAPALAPVLPIRVHPHQYLPHHHHLVSSPHNINHGHRDKGTFRKTLVVVIVSGGATLVLCAIGIIWFCKKFRKERKSTRTVTVYSSCEGATRDRSKDVHTQNSVKVSSDPGPDLFYLDLLTALESQPFSLKQNCPTVTTLSEPNASDYTTHLREESEQEFIKSESDGEIMSVHETVESTKYESDNCGSPYGEKVVPLEAHLSDDESFHSFCDSHSSNVRFSNASMGSLSDISEIVSPNVWKESPCPVTSTMNSTIPLPTQDPILRPGSHTKKYPPHAPPPPPPPPPPPLLPRLHISSHTTSSSKRVTTKVRNSVFPNSSSPRNLDSSSVSTQARQTDILPPPPPPNPPGPRAGIPPPPCPLPLSKGNSNTLKGPPPAPCQLPQYIPLGKDGVPLPKLKPLHWDKVRATPDRSMVWDKLRSSSFELDEEMIESLFGYNLQNSAKNDEAKSKTPSPSKHVLEPKRLQNITILSKALNVTAEQVCDALIQGKGLALQQLEALVKMEPTKEEATKLAAYKGDINELGSAEKLVKAMLNIPFAFVRIEAMLYRETFEDEVIHLRKSFSMLEEACKELRSSRLFLKLLEAVLKTGNRMNVGTIRGGAKAFKLDALLKLSDVKGIDGKTTLLHFVVQEIIRSEGLRVSESIMGKITQKSMSKNAEEREEDYRRMGLDLVSGLSTELCNVKKTATIDLDVLASSVSNLSEGMTKFQNLVRKDLTVDEKSGNLVQLMRFFLNNAEKSLKELQEDENRVLLHVRKITEYFHGDVSKDESNPLRIFVIVRDFLGMLDHVCRELRNLKASRSPNPLAPFR